ncbi:MAG: hypothetical protein IJ408_01545 [Clostridia bacterium]|nr:hypothetical protein [Clostridia bacterium]
MELYKDILVRLLEKQTIKVEFPEFTQCTAEVIDSICYNALKDISIILKNDELTDADCFLKIEEIVCRLEKDGIDFGVRHDFG